MERETEGNVYHHEANTGRVMRVCGMIQEDRTVPVAVPALVLAPAPRSQLPAVLPSSPVFIGAIGLPLAYLGLPRGKAMSWANGCSIHHSVPRPLTSLSPFNRPHSVPTPDRVSSMRATSAQEGAPASVSPRVSTAAVAYG